MADHYKVLQVDRKAEPCVIEAAYESLARRHGKDEHRLKLLNVAKDVLLNAKQREDYDAASKKGGKVVGDYRIIKKLAEGGFGTTYLAEHKTLGTPVCIKHALGMSPTDEALMLEEAKTMWDLRHWGIPAMRDILRMPDGSIALVMSYVPGKTLVEVLEANKPGIDPEHVGWITERILNILMYLHMHGVVHGDLKPQNVIVQNESHTVTLVDYGLAKVNPTRFSSSNGYTPYFAAPELEEGEKPPIAESDLFGLGMTMIFALGGDVEHVKLSGHAADTPEPLVAFIKRLVRRDPKNRPPVWIKEDLCETIKKVRKECFGRTASSMKPLRV